MEYWDLYDKDRNPLGRTHLRGEEFNEGEYYVCCEIWVVNSEGKLLTTKRHPDKKAGNMWEFVGGGTLAGETTKQSAVRELFEETGIRVAEDELTLLATYTRKNYFQDIYTVKSDVPRESLVLQPDEYCNWLFVARNALANKVVGAEVANLKDGVWHCF